MSYFSIKEISNNGVNLIVSSLRQINRFTYTKSFWAAAKKIKEFAFFWRCSPFVRPKDQQSIFEQIKARYIDIETKSEIEPLRGRASEVNLADLLLTNGNNTTQKESESIQRLRVFAKQLTLAIVDCAEGLKHSTDAVRSLEAVKPLVPALTDIFSEVAGDVIQNISFPKTMDGALGYVSSETRAHVAAEHATAQERQRVESLKNIIATYNDEWDRDVDTPTISEKEHDDALAGLREITNAGKEPLLRETYAVAYDSAITAGDTETVAKEKAQKARMDAAKIIKKQNLDPVWTQKCREFYFRDFYFTAFSVNGGTTKVVSKIALEPGIDVRGMQNRDFNSVMDRLVEKVTDKVFDIFEDVIDEAGVPREFLQKYLKTEEADRIETVKRQSVRDIIRPLIFEGVGKAVRMWVVPELLNEQLAFNVLPPIEDQLLKVYIKFIALANWNELAPYFYAYDVAGEEQQKLIGDQIKEKLLALLPVKYGVSIPADMSRERFNESADMMLKSFQSEQSFIRRTLESQAKTAEFYSMVDAFYDMAVTAPAMPTEDDRSKGRAVALASIKSYMFTMIPAECRTKSVSLLNGRAAEDQLNTFHANLTPLIEKIEKRLASLQNQIATAKDKKSIVKQGVMDALSEAPVESFPVYGELVFDVGLKFGQLAPSLGYWSSWVPYLHGKIKKVINDAASVGVAPYRSSHHELVNNIVEALEKKLGYKENEGLDRKKVNEFIFVKKEHVPNSREQLQKEMHVLSKLGFGLAMEVPPMLGWGERSTDWIQWAMKKTVTGEDSTHIERVIGKVQNAYFDNRYINLSRMESIVNLLMASIDDAQKEIARKKSSPPRIQNATMISLFE